MEKGCVALIRVANIIEDGRLGGPQVRMSEVARFLNREGIQNCVIYPTVNNGRFKKRLKRFNIRCIQIHLNHLTKEKRGLAKFFIYFIYEVILIYLTLKREKFDLVHVSGGCWQFKGVIAGKLAGCKVIWHLNDTNMPFFLRILFTFLSRWFTDGLIAAGTKSRNYYVRFLGCKNIPIFNIQAPVNTSYFDPEIPLKSKKNTSDSGIKIVAVGNINPTKGFETFIKIAAEFKENDRVSFYIVGPNLHSQKKYFKKLLTLKENLGVRNLFFLGASDNVREILKEADIYVCTSNSEASPIAVWEAMSMAKPIVSTDVGDVPYFVNLNQSGFILPCGDASGMAERIKMLIQKPELRQEMGTNARRTAVDNLDIHYISRQHKIAYSQIMGIPL